jgi:hypothetical protein
MVVPPLAKLVVVYLPLYAVASPVLMGMYNRAVYVLMLKTQPCVLCQLLFRVKEALM